MNFIQEWCLQTSKHRILQIILSNYFAASTSEVAKVKRLIKASGGVPMVRKITFLKWLGLAAVVLLALPVLFYVYLIVSFDTENFPENHGKVKTEFYVGEGSNQPLIVGLGGAEGGNSWARDVWATQRNEFIAQGYAFLALGYFGMEGIPRELDRVALEGVHQAIIAAASDPRVNQNCIALIGGSKGAELALLLASEYPEIKAVVALAPGSAVFAALTIAMNTPSFSLNGQPLEFVPVPWSATPALIQGDLRAVWEEMLKNETQMVKAAIPIEAINGPIFFVSATQDEYWPSAEMSRTMEQRLAQNNFPHTVEHLAVEGDHGSVLNHFEEIEQFLQTNFLQQSAAGCPR